NIVPVYELGVVDGVYFLAMEHVEGCTLSELLGGGPLAPVEAAEIGAQVLDALGYAHERAGIVHRDVTPRNVLVDAMGHARLVDFGVAARVYANGADVFGSAGYMAPEQARGAVVTSRSDLFSAAAVVAELITGRPLFFRASPEESLRATLEEPLPDLKEDKEIPEELEPLLTASIARDPEKRPHGAHELARKLRTYVATHAPEGVASRLADRVSRAMAARRETELADAVSTSEAPTRDGRTMSIAASRVLTAAIGDGRTAEVSTTTVTTEDLVGEASPATRRAPRSPGRAGATPDDSGGHPTAPHRARSGPSASEAETQPQIAPPAFGQPRRDADADADERPAPATAPLPGRRAASPTAAPALAGVAGAASDGSSPGATDVAEPVVAPTVDPRTSITSSEPAASRRGITPWVAVVLGVALAIPLALAFRAAGPSSGNDPSANGESPDPTASRTVGGDAAAALSDVAPATPTTDVDASSAPAAPGDAGTPATPDAALPIAPPDAGTREPPVARGTIEIAAIPWAEVRIDGRNVGTAPIRGRSVTAGSHDVRASCPPLGANARVRVQVPSNGRVRVSFDLRQDPPVIRVR
ncbi:MAG: protein kinase, partial [Deltaproteobacteria bacterium]|nr:protein kinase [Deltaproteobacteria bacterium]